MNITIVGHVCIDKNTSENSSYTAAGSPAMFMNKIFKQLPGNQVTIIAPFGKDFLGYKGDANIIPEEPVGEETLIYENITKNGIRHQKALHVGVAEPIEINDPMREVLSSSDIVFVAPLTPKYSPNYLKTLLASTQPNTLKVLLPQGYYRELDKEGNVSVRSFIEAEEILPIINMAIVSEQDHSDMFSLAKRWVEDNKIIVVITLGEKGALVYMHGKEIPLPTRMLTESEIVDSVGSGDIFSAGFAYRYQQTNDLHEAGRFANELARQCLFFEPDEIKINYQALF